VFADESVDFGNRGLTCWRKEEYLDTLAKDVLLEFDSKNDIRRNCTTIADLLSHRTGMSWGENHYYINNNVLISGKDSMIYVNSQLVILPYRAQLIWYNILYELAGHMIEKLTGSPWSDVVKSRL